MNFLDIYNHYIGIEHVTEIEPETKLVLVDHSGEEKVIEEPKIPSSLISSEKSPWIIDGPMIRKKPSIYLHLQLLDDHISYQGSQKSTVRMADDGLLEGSYSADRRMTFSREAFTAVVIKTFELWKNAYTYYMVHGDSPKFNKFRDTVVIREERLAPITLKLNDYFHEYYAHKIRLKFNSKKEPEVITIPLVSFSRPAFDFLTNEPVLTISESSGESESEIQNLIDRVLSKFPRWYL